MEISDKEQMAPCLRYINRRGEIAKHFVGVVHIANTTFLTLKEAIESKLISTL